MPTGSSTKMRTRSSSTYTKLFQQNKHSNDMQNLLDPGEIVESEPQKNLTALDVSAICQSLRELADMAYRQKRLRFYGHLTDARILLLKAYLPGLFCTFCSELTGHCRCDEERQNFKDSEQGDPQ